ncbi:N-acetylmuramoyl-L-alanine amidase [Streptomyces botrytidirepellens]|uniref:N-acetylmuramoyl-L-alanine amidase n=1 Tax=Streptomyces botrytidirepellens TaxID=2486417 RepID=A0A3M8VXL9_9ACTN|nr:peptidoglycan recognition family protein [Streptomyces botrytidirepellens]RNG22648.1 N-acetylmuramoyl-L-alanine amidase [Streptomyces botrytidirepellens]
MPGSAQDGAHEADAHDTSRDADRDGDRPVPGPSRRTALRTAGAAASAAFLLPAVSAPAARADQPPGGTPSPEGAGPLQRAFAAAAKEHGVPLSVLLGVSYLQSRWDGHRGAPSVTGGYGPMHLTDAFTALSSAPHHSQGTEDARGDLARPLKVPEASVPEPRQLPARLRTLDRAAELTGLSAAELRGDAAANVRGGAALLAAAQKRLGLPPSDDPADWYAAVAAYPGADSAAAAAVFADDVYEVIRGGAARTTGDGERVTLDAVPGVAPDRRQLRSLGLPDPKRDPHVEAPGNVSCEWIPAPYEQFGDNDYGNHDLGNRPLSQSIDYIVIHDTEGSWDTTIKLVQDPTYVSWQYTLRSSDGHIAQHVPLKDVAWHAGNWYVNAKSIGLEHEGFLTAPDAWYTEAMYRSSARLVKWLARRYGIPLDRQHILGHDNVPGTTATTIRGMHTDPGPYWDWAHYFSLLGAPFHRTAGASGGLVTIRPDYETNEPVYTGCATAGQECAPHGSSAVRLHTAPSSDAPLVKDIGLRPDGADSTTGVNDTGARATTGQQYALAGRQGDWTAIWYLGQQAWFRNPRRRPTAVYGKGLVVTPKPGLAEVPVYGRAYPEKEAYPEGVPVQAVAPLPYKLLAGQRYALGLRTQGEYLWATTFDANGHIVVRGQDVYYQIQFGHRVAFVRAADVRVRRSGR